MIRLTWSNRSEFPDPQREPTGGGEAGMLDEFDPREHPKAERLYYNPSRPAPLEILRELCLVETLFFGYDGADHIGQLVVHHAVEADVRVIFAYLYRARFPVAQMVSISEYDWDDERSMRSNNTSAFNYRFIAGTKKLSQHAYGRAIDINPWFNPQLIDGKPYPKGARYDPSRPGTIVEDSIIVQLFRERGWKWGGKWSDPDRQHFEKPA